MTALIDADSLVYIIGWNYRESGDETSVKDSCDNFLKDILTIVQADDYAGVFSPPSEETFRFNQYHYAPYKGSRPPKADWMVKWEPIIKEYYIGKHGFFTDPDLEADDVVAGMAAIIGQDNCVICSPDKDLRQMAGLHYDYKKAVDGDNLNQVFRVSEEEAFWNFWLQMIRGDGGDNVAGIPGMGDVKAGNIIKEMRGADDIVSVHYKVKNLYIKYFGSYFGRIIYDETFNTLKLMQPGHPLYNRFGPILRAYGMASTWRRTFKPGKTIFDITS